MEPLKYINKRKSHVVIIAVFIVLALFMVVATHYGTKTLSAVRAYIAAEGQWTKGQKEATHLLIQYSIYQQPELYGQFQDRLELHRGFKAARQTLISENPDHDLAFRGFQTADIHSQDTELLIWLSQFYDDISYMEQAYEIWRQGDERIAELDSLAGELLDAVESDRLDMETRNRFIRDIYALDQKLTGLESSFSATMGEAARWIRGIIFWSIVGIGGILVITGYWITRSFFREISDLNQQLLESETKFKKVLQHSRDVIYQLDFQSGNYEYMSPFVEEMLGYTPEQILAEGTKFIVERIHPEDLKRMEMELQEMKGKGVEDHFAGETEFRIRTADDNYIWVNNQRSLVKNRDGKPIAIVGSVRDISERKKHEDEIEESLKEKQTLLEEIHHRVKNNLAVISSLLHLQKVESDEPVQAILEETQSRIKSIAMIHEKLYQTETLSDIDMKEYIKDFVEIISDTFNSQQKDITINQNMQRFSLDITKAVPLGLIFNELLNNAFRHGFAGSKNGKLSITLKKQDDSILLCVADNGHGLPEDFDLQNVQSLGMKLVKTLTKQLKGEVEVTRGEWTSFQITFPAA